MERREALNAANRLRLDQEREKLERYFEYRQGAAAAKLASVERTFQSISLSDDPGVQRIIPVWAKNLENARRVVEGLTADRARLAAQRSRRSRSGSWRRTQMLTGAWVSIVLRYRLSLPGSPGS